eukprot:TRINITY_DN3067_c0_g1_i5.p1 TRINITY_DN3067_c0_g1~~TRINITY_DN3067_c0_g1_i5.p1  ORF type:complete len:957 (-),score=195.58 TRINITY_DN3067_c0_g1_i5:61-2817(-)
MAEKMDSLLLSKFWACIGTSARVPEQFVAHLEKAYETAEKASLAIKHLLDLLSAPQPPIGNADVLREFLVKLYSRNPSTIVRVLNSADTLEELATAVQKERMKLERCILSFFPQGSSEHAAVAWLLPRFPCDDPRSMSQLVDASQSSAAAPTVLAQAQKSRVLALLSEQRRQVLISSVQNLPNTVIVARQLVDITTAEGLAGFLEREMAKTTEKATWAISFQAPGKHNDSVLQYCDVGRQIAREGGKEVSALEDLIETLYKKHVPGTRIPFIALVGSSGVGKTQFAFCLRRPVIYVPLGQSQDIYDAFALFMSSFHACAYRDHTIVLPDHYPHPWALDLDLWLAEWLRQCVMNASTYNFPAAAAGGQQPPLSFTVCKPCTPSCVASVVSNLPIPQRPVVFLDEFQIGNNQHQAALLRNTVVASGLVCITSGSDSSAANLVTFHQRSTVNSKHFGDWAYVVVATPAVSESSLLALFPKFPDLVKSCGDVDPTLASLVNGLRSRHRCRPRFLLYFFDSLLEQFLATPPNQNPVVATLLDTALAHLCSRTLSEKTAVYTEEAGRVAQVQLFCPAHQVSAVSFILDHFAHLDLLPSSKYQLLCLEAKRVAWDPKCSFSTAEEEPLLHLAFAGTKGTASFYDSQHRAITAANALHKIAKTSLWRTVCHENPDQPVNDGTLLENLVCMALTAASRSCGVSGTPASLFFARFVAHMCVSGVVPDEIDVVDLSEFCSALKDLSVGYLPMANTDWPDEVRHVKGTDLDVKLACTKNMDHLDVSFNHNRDCSAKAKDWRKAITKYALCEILRCVPSKSVLHIVVCNKLQQSYFVRDCTTFAQLAKDVPSLQTTSVVRLQGKASSSPSHFGFELLSIHGLPDPNKESKHLVVFVPRNEVAFKLEESVKGNQGETAEESPKPPPYKRHKT